ncbi:MAG: manganese efflux pump [Bacillota bacterium]|nr:manganese efflux pump [Bacillota bacterium]
MHSFILLAAVLSIDALGVGIAYSLKATKIPLISKLIIAAVSVFYGFVAVFAGDVIEGTIPDEFCRPLGGVILIITGFVVLRKTMCESSNQDSDVDNSGKIEPIEALLLGFALSVDMLGAGTGYSMGAGVPFYFPFVAGAFQFGFLYLGEWIGLVGGKVMKVCRREEKLFAFLPPLIIIVLGIIRFFK